MLHKEKKGDKARKKEDKQPQQSGKETRMASREAKGASPVSVPSVRARYEKEIQAAERDIQAAEANVQAARARFATATQRYQTFLNKLWLGTSTRPVYGLANLQGGGMGTRAHATQLMVRLPPRKSGEAAVYRVIDNPSHGYDPQAAEVATPGARDYTPAGVELVRGWGRNAGRSPVSVGRLPRTGTTDGAPQWQWCDDDDFSRSYGDGSDAGEGKGGIPASCKTWSPYAKHLNDEIEQAYEDAVERGVNTWRVGPTRITDRFAVAVEQAPELARYEGAWVPAAKQVAVDPATGRPLLDASGQRRERLVARTLRR